MKRVFKAARNSLVGIKAAIKHHTAFRQEIFIGAALTPLAIYLGEDGVQRAILIGSLVLVLIVELLNSAIETAVDRISTEYHKLSKHAKDLGSAAVFVSVVNVPLIWGLILFQ